MSFEVDYKSFQTSGRLREFGYCTTMVDDDCIWHSWESISANSNEVSEVRRERRWRADNGGETL